MAEAPRLIDGQLDDPLRTRRQADLADHRAITATDDELDRGPHLGELDVHVLEHARRHALALADEAEQQVLGTDVVVVEALGLILGEGEDLSRSVGELVESVHGRVPGHCTRRADWPADCFLSVRHYSLAASSIGTTVHGIRDATLAAPV